MKKYDIVTIGDASEDVFIRPKEMRVESSRLSLSGKMICFELGEKIPIDNTVSDIGGSAANVAVGMSRLGLQSGIVTSLGADSPGERIMDRFYGEEVSTDLIEQKEANKTNFSVIINTADGERTILVYHGNDYKKFKISKKINTSWLFLAPVGENSEGIIESVQSISTKGVKLAWNPGSYQIKNGASKYRELLKRTEVLFLNREEALKFIDYPVVPRDEELMQRLHVLGAKIVIITKGNDGAKAFDGTNYYSVDIIKNIKRIDATGAGDSFATGFLGYLINNCGSGEYGQDDIKNALRWGIVNSTSVVSEIGAQNGLLTSPKIEEWLTTRNQVSVAVN